MNKEIEIPEGYEARIEDNKVIIELKESEDERIRKALIDALKVSETIGELKFKLPYPTREECIAYLEKQKENPKSADSIPSDCTSDAKYEGRWHNVKDSLPDSTREVLCKDAIGNYFIGRYYSKGVWEVSMYDDCDKSNEDNPPVVMWIDIPSEKQKESKAVELDHDREQSLFISAEESLGISQEEYNKIVDECIFGEQKPAEWSEEDEEKINNISEIIEHCTAIPYSGGTLTLSKEYKKELQHFIESLRPVSKESLQPHWKPSEEQMKALDKAIPVCMGVVGRDAVAPLESLYEQLKAL